MFLKSNKDSNDLELTINHLLQEMRSISSYKRADAIKKLGQLDIPITDVTIDIHSNLERALSDPEPEVRREAVMCLAFLEREIVVTLIEPLLDDPDQSVRSNVIAALGFTGKTPPDSITDKLIKYLNDPTPEIRDRCARALGRMNVLKAISKLLELAEFDNSPIVRAGAIVGIGMMKGKNPGILSRIQKFLQKETSQLVRNAIKETLGLISSSFDPSKP